MVKIIYRTITGSGCVGPFLRASCIEAKLVLSHFFKNRSAGPLQIRDQSYYKKSGQKIIIWINFICQFFKTTL